MMFELFLTSQLLITIPALVHLAVLLSHVLVLVLAAAKHLPTLPALHQLNLLHRVNELLLLHHVVTHLNELGNLVMGFRLIGGCFR